MLLGIHAQKLAVRGDDVGGQQVVDGEAVLADEEPNAADQRDPSDPDRADVAEPGCETISCCRVRVVGGCQSCLCPGGALVGINL
jgi:hypothetical protein